MTLLDVPVSRKLPAEVLTAREVDALMRACASGKPGSPGHAVGLRNRALLAVLYRAGLRCAEALALRPKDLDPITGTVRVLHGKGDKSRTVGMDAGAFAVVECWAAVRAKLVCDPAPLLCTLDGGPLQAQYVRALMPRLAARAGVEKRVHAHGMRHSHAFELANEGVPIHVIAAQLGHASAAVTDRYIRHLAPQQVIETMRAREWRTL
jgi:site-specific recombinase XerD